ncbi:hypothetical protein BGZ72_007566 [Mortierella alpina]|nr:hypothetical protein BGZ72_007566 [Mortierella alpina]
MLLKSPCSILLALVLATSVAAQIFDPILPKPSPPSSSPPADPPTSVATSAAPIATTSVPPTAAPTSVAPTAPPSQATTRPRASSTAVLSTSTASGVLPTGTEVPKSGGDSGNKLATAGIVVASVVVAAAIGIWVFRKWKLSPSRDFQSKIRGDEYSDYPRNYDSDTLHLRNIGDTPPVEPAAAKSPYNAQTAFPQEDQYYDPNYAVKDQAGYPAQGTYGHAEYQGYDQGAYNEHGYAQGHVDYNGAQGHVDYNGAQGHVDYNGSQAGGYGGDYSQPYNNQGGYAQSNVGGGYQQHGYEGYGRQ